MGEPSTWLVAFGEIEGLRWVLKKSRMAFSEGLARRATGIRSDDHLVLYVTRGAFHNPTRDHSQLAGLARVTSDVRPLREPVQIAGRPFVAACRILAEIVLPERGGLEFAPLIDRLAFIKRKAIWGQYLRAGLVRLPTADADLLTAYIRKAGGKSGAA
jgi:hypothetical protein